MCGICTYARSSCPLLKDMGPGENPSAGNILFHPLRDFLFFSLGFHCLALARKKRVCDSCRRRCGLSMQCRQQQVRQGTPMFDLSFGMPFSLIKRDVFLKDGANVNAKSADEQNRLLPTLLDPNFAMKLCWLCFQGRGGNTHQQRARQS